jgi:hypothetical protein
MLFNTFGVAFESLVHLIHSKDQVGGKDIFANEVRELYSQIHSIIVKEANRILLYGYLRDNRFKLGADCWDMETKETAQFFEKRVGEGILVFFFIYLEEESH